MELIVSPEKPGFSSSDLASDPEDKVISEGEDEDNDRNHKHRKQEAHSHSHGDSLDQGLTRPYRKRNRPFENGYSYKDSNPQADETCRNHNSASDRGFPSRLQKRSSNQTSFSKAPLELQQRIKGNQTLPSETGTFWGRGREPVSWGIRDSRLGLVDVSSQVVQPGHVPAVLYAGRGFPNVSNTQSTSWNPFGLVPGISNGGLGIPVQRCRDFEERGFCLRGDMCPMEHGVNRIVVEDVQGLSQFNLPVALPGSQLLGTSFGQGALSVNNKHFHGKTNKPEMNENVFGLNSGVSSSDVYDPDQPSWTNDDHGTSALNQSSTTNGTEHFLGAEFYDAQKIDSAEVFTEEPPLRNAAGSQSSVWGRIKRSSEAKEKFDSVRTSSGCHEGDIKSEKALIKESTLKQDGSDSARNILKPSQNALRTLFVHGIPPKDNSKEALLSHFQKFGEVIDIYIPAHGERAFIQFLKREEAEAALKAPDAVMGNRFIRVWWANRDNIPKERIGSGSSSSVPINSHRVTNSASSHHHASGKEGNFLVYDLPKPMAGNGPPQQKKLESLELLKELRKKQELLDQRRTEFRRQLEKLEKQASGSKDVTVTDLTTKRLKVETVPNDPAKAETSKDDIKTTSADNAVSDKSISKSNTSTSIQEHLKPSVLTQTPFGIPFAAKRFKLDNRPTTFRISSPLPDGLANVVALEEHFSTYGELSSVELEEYASSSSSNVSARVSFTSRHFAEKAFSLGKSWQGHKLEFMWLSSSNSVNKISGPGNLSAASDKSNVEPNEENAATHYQKTAALGSYDE